MLAGGSELANAPAVIDVPVGNGHVIMFANNPMWRHQTQGSFFLIFNAALNFDSLNTERAVPAPRARPGASPTPTPSDDVANDHDQSDACGSELGPRASRPQ